MKLAFFYDQSLLVRASVQSVWEAILFGLILSVVIIYFFLKDWGTTLIAIVVIPVTVLITLAGDATDRTELQPDDARRHCRGHRAGHRRRHRRGGGHLRQNRRRPAARWKPFRRPIGEIFRPLVGSTLTPVVVFIPLAFLDGITGVFFRALALTMVVSLLTSLVLAVTLTPSLAAWFIRDRGHQAQGHAPTPDEGGFILRRIIRLYEDRRAHRAAISGG